MYIDWEKVTNSDLDNTYRLKVPGGWLYRVVKGDYYIAVALCFVPEND